MKSTKQKTIYAIKKVAAALEELNEQVAFVGGAVVGLYADDPASADVRPTKDIDLTFEITTYSELEILEKRLLNKGFKHAKDEKVMCRFMLENILVDVMSTKRVGWAPANPWFKAGFKHLINYKLDRTTVKIFPFVYFLATKFSAFHDRGGDPRVSHDFEDIVYLLDNRINLVEEILIADERLLNFLKKQFPFFLKDGLFQEAVLVHLEPPIQQERFKMLQEKLKIVVK